MMSSNLGLKSALLALTMIVAAPATTMHAQQAPVSSVSVSKTILSFVSDHKVAFIGAAAWFIIDTRLRTRPRDTFSMNDLQSDFKELLNSLNIFDSKLYKQLVFLFDKYVIGLSVKIEDSTTRTKNDDGSILTVKGKKLMQKPFGVYGLFDAYVLSHMKKFTEYVPVMAGFYVMLNNPVQWFDDAAAKAVQTNKPMVR